MLCLAGGPGGDSWVLDMRTPATGSVQRDPGQPDRHQLVLWFSDVTSFSLGDGAWLFQ